MGLYVKSVAINPQDTGWYPVIVVSLELEKAAEKFSPLVSQSIANILSIFIPDPTVFISYYLL
jgi:hypothetical protein